MTSMNIVPIGIVKNTKNKEALKYANQNIKFDIKRAANQESDLILSEIIVYEDFVEALDGIEEFSHLIIVFWIHKNSDKPREIRKVHPGGLKNMSLKGIFATRSPARPNPIGITTVRLIERRENVLVVDGIDAINDTPVIDIKPHLPYYDSPPNVKIADWVNELMEEYAVLNNNLKKDFYKS